MADGVDGDAGGEIQEAIAVHVFDHGAERATDDQGVEPGIGGRHHLGVSL